MKKRPLITRVLLSLLVIALGVWFAIQKQAVGYQSDHTIAKGQLRDTTNSLVSSAENSTINYQKQYRYIEDIGDGRGYTAGIIGFTTKNGDLLEVVNRYQKLRPKNKLVKFIPALKQVLGTDSHKGLGEKFIRTWQQVSTDKKFIQAQNYILDQQYMKPALQAAKKDNLGPLGQYIYYDALVVHGPGNDADSFGGIRKEAKIEAKSPVHNQGAYLRTFLQLRSQVMRKESAHHDLSRIKVQEKFIKAKNYQLQRPLKWTMYGDSYQLK